MRECRVDAPFAALAFKIMVDPFVGRLAFCRIYSGSMDSGMALENVGAGKKERVGRILRMHANKREELESAHAGRALGAGEPARLGRWVILAAPGRCIAAGQVATRPPAT